ncbi:MAG: hypothetical protein WCI04_05520 [archaeon]
MDKKLTKKNSKHLRESNLDNAKGFNVIKFAGKKPGFIIAIIAIVVIILLLLFVQYDPTGPQQKLDYAQQFYSANQSDMNAYLQSIIEEQTQQQATTLDESYLSSTKADIEWLIAKENIIYNSKPAIDVYPKEAAFTLFAKKIIQVNSEYAFAIEGDSYDSEIALGLAVDYKIPELLTPDEITQAFTNDGEIAVYKNTLSQLFNDYINLKKQFMKNITSKERQYVEAKKLILLATIE